MLKRKPLSLKRLYMLAVGFCKSKSDMEKIAKFLKYVSVHKEDNL